jgi:hypothetical protein
MSIDRLGKTEVAGDNLDGESVAKLVERSGSRLKKAFLCTLVLLCMECLAYVLQGVLLSSAHISAADAETNDLRVLTAVGSQVVFQLFVLVPLFLRWTYLIQKENRRLFPSSQYSPAWTCWSFFVPFANLVVPYRALKETRSSFGVAGHDAFRTWWLAFLISGFLSSVGRRAMTNAQFFGTVDDLVAANWWFIFSSAIGAFSAWLAIKVVGGTTGAVVAMAGTHDSASLSLGADQYLQAGPFTDDEGSGKYEA